MQTITLKSYRRSKNLKNMSELLKKWSKLKRFFIRMVINSWRIPVLLNYFNTIIAL